jgi:hypothetical protein
VTSDWVLEQILAEKDRRLRRTLLVDGRWDEPKLRLEPENTCQFWPGTTAAEHALEFHEPDLSETPTL